MAANIHAGSASSSEARGLLGAWPFGEPASFAAVSGGATNRVYRVAYPERVAFLRVYERRDPALVLREHALIAHVRESALPAVAPIPARDGHTVVERGGLVCALYEPAPGQQIQRAELTRAHASQAGALLAKLHCCMSGLPDVGYVRWELDWDSAAWIERLNVVERAIVARRATDATDAWALTRLRAQRAWLGQSACAHRYQPAFPPQVIHGDYHGNNLFFERLGVSAVIDWEQAAYMPRAYEAVRACGLTFQLEPELTRSFLAAYVEGTQLSMAELSDGARAWGCFSDHHVWPAEQVYLHANEAARLYIPHVPFRPFLHAWATAL
jgi:homoserine kinase type II